MREIEFISELDKHGLDRMISIDNLKSASKYAGQDIKDRWEWYKERYMKKMIKK